MIQRDYFLCLIEEFQAAVARFLEKDKAGKDEELKDLYRQYVGDYELLRNCSVDELFCYANDNWGEEKLEKINMVAELLYAETSYCANPLRAMLMEKAYTYYDYVEANGDMFSIERRKKMQALKKELRKV